MLDENSSAIDLMNHPITPVPVVPIRKRRGFTSTNSDLGVPAYATDSSCRSLEGDAQGRGLAVSANCCAPFTGGQTEHLKISSSVSNATPGCDSFLTAANVTQTADVYNELF